MGKQEIGWTVQLEDGVKQERLAHRAGRRWRFMERNGRYDPWREIAEPSREDWDKLLDLIRRRYQRKGFSDVDVRDVEREIEERFPD
ncbi:MAG: hypothetical protein EXS18_06500 [Verrucomicrobiae bacterium]|nr:hypothetical protein [Verrucomicrobiae bacterium]